MRFRKLELTYCDETRPWRARLFHSRDVEANPIVDEQVDEVEFCGLVMKRGSGVDFGLSLVFETTTGTFDVTIDQVSKLRTGEAARTLTVEQDQGSGPDATIGIEKI